jgi:hypothetical protein
MQPNPKLWDQLKLHPGDWDATASQDIEGGIRQRKGPNPDPNYKGDPQTDQAMWGSLYKRGWTNNDITNYLRSLPADQSQKINQQYWNTANQIHNPDPAIDKWMQGLSLALSLGGLTAGAGAVVAPAIAGAVGGGLGGSILGGAGAGALSGAAGAALQGKPIGKGALTGAVGGGFTGGAGNYINSGISDQLGNGALGDFAGGVGSGAVRGALTSAVGGGNPLKGAEMGGITGGINSGLQQSGINDYLGQNIGSFAPGMAGAATQGLARGMLQNRNPGQQAWRGGMNSAIGWGLGALGQAVGPH